jgi:hypothetical protein
MRSVVDCLPYETKVAMLEGMERYDIIAGAYSERGGGVCPMLAAHRCGGRTDFPSFARAWDRFTGAGKARRASERELRTLKAQLERSLWNEERARAELTRIEPVASERQPVELDAAEPLHVTATDVKRDTAVGAWLVPFRDLADYRRALEAALRQVEQLEAETASESETEAPVPV